VRRVFVVVEMQGIHHTKSLQMLATVDQSQATDAGKSRRKSRKRSKGRKGSGDAVGGDVNGKEDTAESYPAQDLLFLSAGSAESYPTRASDDTEDAELFEVKRYPAYHYDMYGTIYSLTDGVRPTTLERDTIKSASADCLDVLSLSAQASQRSARNDEVSISVPQTSALAAEQRKPKPAAKPKPLPRTKQGAKQSTVSVKDTATQPAMKSASTDPALVAELSSLIKQRNE